MRPGRDIISVKKVLTRAYGNSSAGTTGQFQAPFSLCAWEGAAIGAAVINHCVEVRVNGRLLALGELVQLEDRLGIELHEVYRKGASDSCK